MERFVNIPNASGWLLKPLRPNIVRPLLLRFSRPPGTIQNLTRFSTDAHLDERNWEVAVGGGREREIGPFASGTRVSVKAASLTGSTTDPQYSAVKNRLVQ